MTDEELTRSLIAEGYHYVHVAGERWVAIRNFMYTVAIIEGKRSPADTGYEDRWCYHDLTSAIVSYVRWVADDLEGEPDGWHRHPTSGRRRDPDTGREWINP